jgi:outer membrane protein assembly factor BamB
MLRLLAASLIFFIATPAFAENWPCWRGPRLDGSSAEKNLPLTWSEKENVAWKTPIPGVGHSSPIVHGDRVFLTTCLLKEGSRLLFCIDRHDGQIVWRREVLRCPLEPSHGRNSRASATPATDGRYVYTSFLRLRPKTDEDGPPTKPREKSPIDASMVPEMVITCWDYDGNRVWEKVPGRFYSRHGYCSSPILYKDTVIINGDQDALAYIVALDKRTGTEAWRIDRSHRMRSYCVPLIVEAGGRTQMVLTGNEGVASHNPDTGDLLWAFDGPTEQYVASPVWGDGLFFMTAGYPDYHDWTVTPEGKTVWHEKKTTAKKAAYVPSPIALPGHFWMISDEGWLSSFEAQTGKRTFFEQLGRERVLFSASPVLADGHVYLPDEDGVTHVLKAGGTFDVVSRNRLPEKICASPAVSQGQILLRTVGHLYCMGKK